MKTDENSEAQEAEFEVLPPEDKSISEVNPSSSDVLAIIKQTLFTCPAIIPIKKPEIQKEDLEEPFSSRFLIALNYSIANFEYILSKDGSFRAFSTISFRWFLFLMVIVLVFGIPLLFVAQALDAVASFIESIMAHLWQATLYLLGILLIASAIIGAVMLASRKK